MTKTVLDNVEREKRFVALSSVIAAVFLTSTQKLYAVAIMLFLMVIVGGIAVYLSRKKGKLLI